MSSTLSSLHRAGRWFLASGIQEVSGGVARYYRQDLGRNARVSTEITGYAVSALVYLWQRTGRGEYLEAAVRAADFLVGTAWNRALRIYPFELAADGEASLAYFFDSGIIARGLAAVWRATGEARYLEAAVEGGRSMIRDFASAGGFHPVLALPAKVPLPHEPRWSRAPGCYQLKSALAWHELSAATGEAEFAAYYDRAVAGAVATHATFVVGEPDAEKRMDRLHAYVYFLEGLIPAAGRAECAAALRDGISSVARELRALAPRFERSDVYAQLVRMRLYAAALGLVPMDRAAAIEEVSKTARFQLKHTDARVRNGFCFGRRQGRLVPFVNPVSTAFGAQALDMWRQYEAGEFRPRIESLI